MQKDGLWEMLLRQGGIAAGGGGVGSSRGHANGQQASIYTQRSAARAPRRARWVVAVSEIRGSAHTKLFSSVPDCIFFARATPRVPPRARPHCHKRASKNKLEGEKRSSRTRRANPSHSLNPEPKRVYCRRARDGPHDAQPAGRLPGRAGAGEALAGGGRPAQCAAAQAPRRCPDRGQVRGRAGGLRVQGYYKRNGQLNRGAKQACRVPGQAARAADGHGRGAGWWWCCARRRARRRVGGGVDFAHRILFCGAISPPSRPICAGSWMVSLHMERQRARLQFWCCSCGVVAPRAAAAPQCIPRARAPPRRRRRRSCANYSSRSSAPDRLLPPPPRPPRSPPVPTQQNRAPPPHTTTGPPPSR